MVLILTWSLHLADKQHLAVLRQCPESVFHNHFQMVCFVADGFHFRLYGIVIGDGTLMYALDMVGHTSCVGEFFYQSLYVLCAFCYLLDEFHVASRQLLCFFSREYVFCALNSLN